MKFENTEVWGFEHAIRGMRNPKESWNRSDSGYCGTQICPSCSLAGKKGCRDTSNLEMCNNFTIGKNDLELMQTLIKAGSEHRKFIRQIFVSCDITAPLYWWKEFDTYKVGTVANSTSTMHKLASTPITMDCFEMDDFIQHVNSFETDNVYHIWRELIIHLEKLRETYNENKDKKYWKELIRLLPESWLQTRTITMNYENLLSMVHQRENHKLTEWSESFIGWVKTLPYAEELIFIEK